VLLIAILFGFSLAAMGEKGKPVFDFVEQVSHVLFGIVNSVMKLAPLGAFGAMAFTIGKYGVGSLVPMAKLMGAFYLTCGLFILWCWAPSPATPALDLQVHQVHPRRAADRAGHQLVRVGLPR
jgi:Na+/H+-dicarboxylate symporter